MSKSLYRTYLVEYAYQGERWGAEIKAASFSDAQARIEAMGAFGQINGEIHARIPTGAGPLVRAWTWLANLGRST